MIESALIGSVLFKLAGLAYLVEFVLFKLVGLAYSSLRQCILL